MTKAQVIGTYFQHHPFAAEMRQRQRRIGTRGDNQMHLCRHMFKQINHTIVYLLRFDEVIVVQHKGKILRDGGEVVDQSCQYRLDGWRRGGVMKSHGSLTGSRWR